MKAVGIVGSPRKAGNTEILTAHCLKAIAEEGLETELIRLAGLDIRGCNHCEYCFEHEGSCSIEDDMLPIYDEILNADGLVIGSPVYVAWVTAQTKAVIVDEQRVIVARALTETGANVIRAAERAFAESLQDAGLREEEVEFVVGTGGAPLRPFGSRYGALLMLSMPAATYASPSPALIALAASMADLRPEPHTLLTVTAPTEAGRPAPSSVQTPISAAVGG